MNVRIVRTLLALSLAACGGSGDKTSAESTLPPAHPPAETEASDTPPPAPAAAAPNPLVETAKGAQLFDGLGTLHRAVTTANPEAQKYFDQGLRLSYGFNHDEATRSFAQAAVLDPSCAMCFWGAALTMGPNYNVPMLPDRAKTAWDALQRAIALAPKGSPVEKALIGALAKRYPGPDPKSPPEMQPYNEAYAAAMRDVAKKFPDDVDVQVLFAESMMDVNPWHLWTLDGKPAPGTEEIVATLEGVLAKDPKHPGANHYYIHAVEASPQPDKAVVAADRLPELMPNAGHVVHMPAHIYQRVGRYEDAAAANRRAVDVDHGYLAKTTPPGYYPMYLGHNFGFLAFAASMEGRAEESMTASRETVKALPPGMIDMMPGMDFFVSEPILVMVRFSKWDDLLKEPKPDAKYLVLTGLWLHGHGMALAAKGKLADAEKDLAALTKLGESAPADLQAGLNSAKDVFAVAAAVLRAKIAQQGKKKDALDLWAKAVALEDKLAYSEPADWFYPVRHFQGAALLAAGKAKDAEAVYREDLRRNPGNGWALNGLAKALAAQGKKKDAAEATEQFKKAWAKADVKPASSVL